MAEIDDGIETALWNTVRAMQEGTMLLRQLAAHADVAHTPQTASKLSKRTHELDRQADVLRQMTGSVHAMEEADR
jgi:hypothetical protein